jgi:hypothetical protein
MDGSSLESSSLKSSSLLGGSLLGQLGEIVDVLDATMTSL